MVLSHSVDLFWWCRRPVSRMGHVNTKQEVLDAFGVFDPNGQGVVSSADFQNLVYSLGEQMSQQDAQELLAEAVGQNGYVNYPQLVESWFSFDR
jgi:Ca2+-binding EF-hand superfamily protein